MAVAKTTRATMSVDEAAELLGVSRNTAFKAIAKDGALAGINAIRVGKRILLPRRPIEELVGPSDSTE